MFAKLQNVDRRVIYLLIFLALAIPLLKPLGIPLSYSNTTILFYDEIAKLQAGDTVLVALDYSPGGSPDVHPQAVTVAQHLVQKGVKIVMVSFWDAGPMYGEQILQPYVDSGDLVYGESVTNLGYISGGATAIRNFSQNVVGTQPVDFGGRDVASQPIMEGIKDLRDFDLVVEFMSGTPGLNEWIQQATDPMGVKILCGSVTVSVPGAMPFIDSGQCAGMLQGLRGAAEYEIMSGNPGKAAAGMDAQSLGHVVIIAFILVGNIAFFASGKGKKSL